MATSVPFTKFQHGGLIIAMTFRYFKEGARNAFLTLIPGLYGPTQTGTSCRRFTLMIFDTIIISFVLLLLALLNEAQLSFV